MNNLVSILIPVYNSEKWIAETINSSINQTWSNKEIIIVDDGSTDNTLQIAREFQSKSLMVITQKTNRGASAARNNALSYAQGDYIQWLDADDLLHPNKIEYQFKQIEKDKDTGILFSSAYGLFYFRYLNARFIPNALWKDLSPVEWITLKFIDFNKNWISNSA